MPALHPWLLCHFAQSGPCEIDCTWTTSMFWYGQRTVLLAEPQCTTCYSAQACKSMPRTLSSAVIAVCILASGSLCLFSHAERSLILQGMPDWALLYAGGRVVGHSKPYKAAEPALSDWTYWGCYLWPGCHAVAPRANKVSCRHCSVQLKVLQYVCDAFLSQGICAPTPLAPSSTLAVAA